MLCETTGAEKSLDPDLVRLVRNLAVAHAREDYRRATGQIDEGDGTKVMPEGGGDAVVRLRRVTPGSDAP